MLEISRPDIHGEHLMPFTASNRFLKLPVQPYLELLGLYSSLNRPQCALINAINSPQYRFVVAALARRLGKTYIANTCGQLVTLMPGSNVLIMSPNFSLSSISFELQRRFINHFNLEVARDNLKDRLIELSNGSTIRMGSVSTVDSAVGRSYDLIIFDEAALSVDGESAFNVALRPTLDKPNSKCVFISTPRGRLNWFSQFYDRGWSDAFPDWISLRADYSENPRMSVQDVDSARLALSHAEFEQEYCASFTVFQGQIYSFNREHVVEPPAELCGEYIAGCDPGYRDATAYVVVCYEPSTDLFWVVDEYVKSGVSTSEHASEFNRLNSHYGVETVFIDSAAAQFAADLAYQYNCATTRARKDVLPGIAYVQNIIENNRLRVAPHCVHTLAMLDQYRWDTNTALQRERPVHDLHSHIADALRYCLYSYTL